MVSEHTVWNILLHSLLSLNPCSTGRWSRRTEKSCAPTTAKKSLNPCFTGRWSRSTNNLNDYGNERRVLILVLLEDGLGEGLIVSYFVFVLILVLVEDGLGDNENINVRANQPDVLILVLVEDGLGEGLIVISYFVFLS